MADGMSGKPLWMASTRADMSESLAVAIRTSFHVIGLMSVVAVDAQICVQRHAIGSSRLTGRESQHRPLDFVTRLGYSVADSRNVQYAKPIPQ